MKTITFIPPANMSPAARASEITAILTAAVTRCFLANIDNIEKRKQLALGFLPEQSVHTTPYLPTRSK
jgi:hypothetical protein